MENDLLTQMSDEAMLELISKALVAQTDHPVIILGDFVDFDALSSTSGEAANGK